MVSSSKWKKTESTVAEVFNCERTPFSGSTSGLTSADTLHENIFIECKTAKKHSVRTLYDKTKELAIIEGKIPLLVLRENNAKPDDTLWVFESKYLFNILQEIDLHKINNNIPKGTTIYKLFETKGESVVGLYEIQQDIDRQIDEIIMDKKITKENKYLLKSLSIISYYIENIRDFQKTELDDKYE